LLAHILSLHAALTERQTVSIPVLIFASQCDGGSTHARSNRAKVTKLKRSTARQRTTFSRVLARDRRERAAALAKAAKTPRRPSKLYANKWQLNLRCPCSHAWSITITLHQIAAAIHCPRCDRTLLLPRDALR
jgi:hypothetical protein